MRSVPSSALRSILRRHRVALAPKLLLSAIVLVISSLIVPPGALAGEAPDGSDPRALEVADRLMTALGGEDAWNATRFFEFGFFGRRNHVWDKHTGRHRVEGETQEGEKYIVLHNVHDEGKGDGRVFLDGNPVEGDAKSTWLERAYGAWINDTYWLVMPYKLQDPGVHLSYEGTEEVGGKTYDVVRLSFEQVGLTPGDRYWAHVNRDTGLMDRWSYHLESMGEADPPTVWDWVDWARYGEIRLSPTRKQVAGERELSLAPISLPDSVPDAVFEEP